ncbi:MAG: DUF3048 domain-containing protein [Clostridia bacterium]|nr:DUF3048 domain-containing protein [Clostridia bacterium]
MLGKRWQWVIAAVAAVLLPIQALAAEVITLPYVRESSTEITVEIPPENVPEAGVNPLTGESWQGAYHPVMVQIDADPDALPHWGVAAADVMYEMPLHMAGNTRSVALFMSNMPPYAGPVRSSRVPMASLREMWGAAWAFCGTQQDWRGTNTTIDVADFVLSFHEEAR